MLVRIACLALLLCPMALAQKEDRRRLNATPFDRSSIILGDIESARWKVGGNLYITPLIGFRQLGYDNNVFSTETNEIKDASLSPELGVVLYYRPTGSWIWENRATYNYLYYFDLESLRGGEYGGQTRLHGILKRVYVDGGVNFQRDRQRLTSEIDERIYSERVRSDLNLTLEPNPRSQVNLGAAVSRLGYDESESTLFERLDRDELAVSFRYHYRLREKVWPFFEVDHHHFNFELPGTPTDDSSFTGAFFGIRTERSQRMTLDFKAGLQQLDFQTQSALVPGEDGPVLDPSQTVDMDDDVLAVEGFMRYRLTRRHYLETSVLNTPLFSISPEYSYFLSSKASVELGLETRRHWRMGPELLIGSNQYEPANQLPPPDPQRKDDFHGLNFNVYIPYKRLFELRLSVGYLERKSNQTGAADKGYQISTSLRYGEGPRWWD